METKKLKILAIDDNRDNLITLQAVVADVLPGTRVLTSLNGRKGIELAETEDPDVILLDIIMPEMDGFLVCQNLKSDEKLRHIPVLFLTALKTNREVRFKALEAGAEGFLSKPFDETELIAQVLSMAKIKEAKVHQLQENERLEILVGERTRELKQELLERRKIEQVLRESEERFRAIFENAPLGMAVFDPFTNQITQVNKKFTEIFGRSKEELFSIHWQTIIHPDDWMEEMSFFELIKAISITGNKLNNRFIKPDGSIVWVDLTIAALEDKDKVNYLYIGMVEDITERKKKEEEILFLSYHDVLTGLYNRRFLDEKLKCLDTERQLPISIIMGDVNGLKLINDGFGHEEGDKTLIQIGSILKKCCREADIVARIGGDEFCIFLPNTRDEEVQKICKRIIQSCEEYRTVKAGEVIFPSISLGYGTKASADESIDNVKKKAEAYMYRRKLLESKSMYSSLLTSIKTTMFEKSHETEEHCERLVELSLLTGQRLNLKEEELNDLKLFATLHDIGKIAVDDQILNKPGKLTDVEWCEMKKHPEIGYRIALASPELAVIAGYILSHHERWDGKGYPQGLIGENIPLLSRIVAIVDAYDAMTKDRPYRKAISHEAAVEEIIKNSGIQFDPENVRIFLEIIGHGATRYKI